MTECYDLHCHSTASDGALSPAALVQRAHSKGVGVLAVTDHDTLSGLAAAMQEAETLALRIIAGIELSTNWHGHVIHLVGLNINPAHQLLLTTTQALQQVRQLRAEKIAEKLSKKGIMGSLAVVRQNAGEGMVTRNHFAQFLLAEHHVSTHQEAFDRYLGSGKSAYVATSWMPLAEAVNVIVAAGGVAVIAHPLRYQLSRKWMLRLLTDFKEAGGQGIEVVTSRINSEEIHVAANYALQFALRGSVGSDFHHPGCEWVELGRLATLPNKIRPVWELFG